MKKPSATYSLESIKKLIREGQSIITTSALMGAAELEFIDEDIHSAILLLSDEDFYKTMASKKRKSTYQDVYRKEYKNVLLYIKLQIVEQAIVISFKEK